MLNRDNLRQGVSSGKDDRGAILPIMALLLVGLLVIAAIVVDLGGAREVRRRNQGSVDGAALAAAQNLPDETAALATAKAIAQADFGFVPDLNSCAAPNTDPHALTGAVAPGNNCVTFDAGGSRIRVYYRGTYQTAFGSVINSKSVAVNTGATAQRSPRGFGGILPLGIPAGAGTGEVCLKTGSSGTAVGACSGASSGNFHYLDVAEYGSGVTPQRCNTGSHDALLTDNVAMGIDHIINDYAGTTTSDAYITCPVYNAGPDVVTTETGNVASVITGPLMTDPVGSANESDGLGARLQRGSFVCTATNTWAGWPSPYSCTTVENATVDDVPLWHFIGSGSSHTLPVGADVPNSCQYSVFTSKLSADTGATESTRAADMRGLLDTCFAEYAYGDKAGTPCLATDTGCTKTPGCGAVPCTAQIFGYNTNACSNTNLFDIQCTPRFGYTPVVCNTLTTAGPPYPPACTTVYPSGSSGNVFVLDRQPVFIQRLTDDNANKLDFEPGVAYGSTKAADISNIIAFSFARTMLPGHLGDPNAPNDTDVNQFISLVR